MKQAFVIPTLINYDRMLGKLTDGENSMSPSCIGQCTGCVCSCRCSCKAIDEYGFEW